MQENKRVIQFSGSVDDSADSAKNKIKNKIKIYKRAAFLIPSILILITLLFFIGYYIFSKTKENNLILNNFFSESNNKKEKVVINLDQKNNIKINPTDNKNSIKDEIINDIKNIINSSGVDSIGLNNSIIKPDISDAVIVKNVDSVIDTKTSVNEPEVIKKNIEPIIPVEPVVVISPERQKLMNYFNDGVNLFMGGDYVGAIKNFDNAILIDKNYHVAYYYKANSLYELKKYQDALSVIDVALKLSPNDQMVKDLKVSIEKNLN